MALRYAGVIIDNKSRFTDEIYTYGCNIDHVDVGSKVYVPFGRSKDKKAAYVFAMSDEPKGEFAELKYIDSVDESVTLPVESVKLAAWMHDRYLCRYMDALKLFLPAGKPLKSGKRRENPLAGVAGEQQPIEALTDEQEAALSKIVGSIEQEKEDIFLLHGVTGSGKTEVYMQAIEKTLAIGKTCVMLVPEISLTKQIIDRFVGRFGSGSLAVLHSGLSPGERYEQWQRIREGSATIVIGARSAVFAPLQNIGLIVMDEEHESSYKSDMSPKYDTLEVAIKRLKDSRGTLVLGSATPSVVSYQRAEQGIYKTLPLTKRYNEVAMPKMEVVDLREELTHGNTNVISRRLYGAVKDTLEAGEQAILFMNRRGYQTFVSCRTCGHVMTCPTCGISMTYHKSEKALVCHYCDRKEPMPKVCPSCQSSYIKGFGTGTEKVMESVAELFPEAKLDRLDLDTMSKKGALEEVLGRFQEGQTDILIGTQVVAKGLDFRNVGLVGIVSCDVLLNVPDYRASERAFQLITQSAGRAGRGDKQGLVIVQTYTPQHYAVTSAVKGDYEGFVEKELERRKELKYQPFGDVIQVVFGSGDERTCMEAARNWRKGLVQSGADPLSMLIPKMRIYERKEKEYRACLVIRSGPKERATYLKHLAVFKENARKNHEKYSPVVDVNPYDMWRG